MPKTKNFTKYIAFKEVFYIALFTYSINIEAVGILNILSIAGSVTATVIPPLKDTMLVAEHSDIEDRVAAAAAASAKVEY